jgi:hypothetical protein
MNILCSYSQVYEPRKEGKRVKKSGSQVPSHGLAEQSRNISQRSSWVRVRLESLPCIFQGADMRGSWLNFMLSLSSIDVQV